MGRPRSPRTAIAQGGTVPARHIRDAHVVGAIVATAVLATGLAGCVAFDHISGNSGTVWTGQFSGAELHLTVENARLEVGAGTSSGTLTVSSGRYDSAVGAPTPVVHDGTLAWADPCPSGSARDCFGSYTVGVPIGVAVDVSGSNSPTTVSGLATALTVTLNPCLSLKVERVSGPLTLSCTGGNIDSTGIAGTDLDSTTVSATESAAPGASGGVYLGFDASPT